MAGRYVVTVVVTLSHPKKNYTRVAEKLVHGLVQEFLPGESVDTPEGKMEITGAGVVDVTVK